MLPVTLKGFDGLATVATVAVPDGDPPEGVIWRGRFFRRIAVDRSLVTYREGRIYAVPDDPPPPPAMAVGHGRNGTVNGMPS